MAGYYLLMPAQEGQPSSLSEPSQAPVGTQTIPTEPQMVLVIKPSLLGAILLRIVVAAILVGVVVGTLLVANKLVGFDIIQYLLNAAQSAIANLREMVPEFAALLAQLFANLSALLSFIAAIVVAIVLLRAIPLVNQRWKLYADRLEYTKGLIFVKEETVPIAALALVDAKKALPLLDIGTITVVVSGVNQPLTMPMVWGAMEKAERMRTVQRAKQEEWRQNTGGV